MAPHSALLFSLLLIFSFVTFTSAQDCVYGIYVKTGKKANASTDSNISLTLYNDEGDVLDMGNLVDWGGLMGSDYQYFQAGNLDSFSQRGDCLSSPVCAMNLTSDGSGSNPNWYCDYVKVVSSGVNSDCSDGSFKVEQWLLSNLTSDELITTSKGLTMIQNNCGNGVEIGFNAMSSVVSLGH